MYKTLTNRAIYATILHVADGSVRVFDKLHRAPVVIHVYYFFFKNGGTKEKMTANEANTDLICPTEAWDTVGQATMNSLSLLYNMGYTTF